MAADLDDISHVITSHVTTCMHWNGDDLVSYQRVSGGYINFVWRVQHKSGTSFIIKYSPPYIASSPAVPFSSERLRFELNALVMLEETRLYSDDTVVHIPRVVGRVDSAPIGVLSDLGPGSKTLDQQWQTIVAERDDSTAREQMVTWMGHLGRFCGRLHIHTFLQPTLREQFQNSNVQAVRMEVQYTKMGITAAQIAKDLAVSWTDDLTKQVDKVSIALGHLFQSEGFCLTMGDFWPRSVLTGGELGHCLGIIDWEFAHWGNPAQDLGHMMAHVILLSTLSTAAANRIASAALHALCETYSVTVHEELHEKPDQLAGWVELWRGKSVSQAILQHCGCELLARLGSFRAGYVMEHASSDVVMAVFSCALACLLDDESPFTTPNTLHSVIRDAVHTIFSRFDA